MGTCRVQLYVPEGVGSGSGVAVGVKVGGTAVAVGESVSTGSSVGGVVGVTEGVSVGVCVGVAEGVGVLVEVGRRVGVAGTAVAVGVIWLIKVGGVRRTAVFAPASSWLPQTAPIINKILTSTRKALTQPLPLRLRENS